MLQATVSTELDSNQAPKSEDRTVESANLQSRVLGGIRLQATADMRTSAAQRLGVAHRNWIDEGPPPERPHDGRPGNR